MISAYLIAAGPFLPFVLLGLLAGLIWLALWLLGKGGWRAALGWLIVGYIALNAASLVLG